MNVSYDVFAGAFLSKVNEFDFIRLSDEDRESIIDGFMKRSFAEFKSIYSSTFLMSYNDDVRECELSINDNELDELANIVSEGMLVQWLKPYVYRQENLENVLNTRDFITYSPAELLLRVGNAYNKAQKDYLQMIREYSYVHGDLSDLHL